MPLEVSRRHSSATVDNAARRDEPNNQAIVIETYLMKERMQKTLSQVNGCPQRNRSETEWYGGVQTFMWMCEDNIVEVPFDKEQIGRAHV